MRAAQLSSDLGRPDQAQRIIGGIAATDLDVVTRAHMARLEEALDVHLGAGPERVRHLVELAQQAAAAGESDLGMELLLCAARRCWWTDPGRELRLTVARTALSLPAQEPLQPLLQAVLAFAAPDAYEGVVRERLTAFSRDHSLEAGQLTRLGIAGAVVGDFALARTMFAAAVPQLRSAGRLSLLARALHHDAYCAIHTGDWDGAAAAAHEVEELAAEFGQRRWIALAKVPQAWVAALRGQTDSVARLAAAAEHVLAPVKSGDALAFLQLARGLAALGEGDYGRAYGHLRRLFDPADSAYHHLLKYQALADFAAAAAHSGHRDDARAVVAGLADWATEDPSSLPAVNLAAATMLLADDADVEDLFRAALSGGLRAWPWHHACLELEYGGWLRRSRRAADSRGHLTTARDAFALLGAPSWRDRAQRELRASGVRPSGAASRNAEQTLTAQEREIAGFVVEGLSNRQIGERLHLSHRTVATHLYRMFPKLGITSRAELSGVLGGRTTADAATADTATADTDARRTTPRRLPPAPGHFTGRDGELRAATAWLEAAGQPGARHAAVATVSGMAGVGKTALAVQWAHRLTGRYPDGQLATDLRGFGDGDALDPRDALEAFLVALGVQRRDIPVALADRTAMFRDRTAGLRVLVLLDNARDAAQVRPLLPASPTALTLVTSRNRLTGLAVSEGAASFTLEPWNTPEAVAALASRIGPARLGEEAAAAAGLVALCGGLPLAVALVAARLQGNEELPVAVALAELQEGAHTLDAFTDQDRGVDLRTVFSWSYRELSPEAARLFRLLSLHPGSEINADEAAALIAEPLPSTRALLRELGGAHLIRETPKGLYTFHVLLRVYAGELARARDTEHARAAAYHRLTSRPLQ
jgi:DNA-binding CsgD family transcriptional regulator